MSQSSNRSSPGSPSPSSEEADPHAVFDVLRLPMSDPGDVADIATAIDKGDLDPHDVIGIISQPEGTGYARALTTLQVSHLLADRLGESPDEVIDRIPMMMIGLCGGLMSPHHNVITRRQATAADAAPGPRLAVGVGSSPTVAAVDLGTTAQVEYTAAAVRAAMADGGMEPEDVTSVEVKCPAMTPARAEEVAASGGRLLGGNLNAASSYSKAAAALGVAVALGEVDAASITDDVINQDRSLYTSRGSVSAGGEQTACRVLVFGNSATAGGHLRAGRGVMEDQLDVGGVLAALRDAGIDEPSMPLSAEHAAQVRQVFVNCGADLTTHVRGRRHTIGSDFLAGHAGVIAKAVAHATVAAVVGDPMILASAGAEHQGKPGENLVAAIVEMPDA